MNKNRLNNTVKSNIQDERKYLQTITGKHRRNSYNSIEKIPNDSIKKQAEDLNRCFSREDI